MEEGSIEGLKSNIEMHIFCDIKTTFKMALPPIFLILSNELLLVSSSILPVQSQTAGNYTIIGVAIFTVLVLKKRFFLSQALAVYFVARGLDQFPSDYVEGDVNSSDSLSTFYGHFSIVWAILCYGMSYVILEKVLKSSEVSLWIRGIQLNLFTVPLSLLMSFTYDWMNDNQHGFFDNFSLIAWFFVVFKVAQLMMELFVIKVADSIYRCLALSTALVIIGILKHPFSIDDMIPAGLGSSQLGAGLVLAGICLYTVMDHFPKWGELNDLEQEFEYREPPQSCNNTDTKGYLTVPTVSSAVWNADVYLKLIDEPTSET